MWQSGNVLTRHTVAQVPLVTTWSTAGGNVWQCCQHPPGEGERIPLGDSQSSLGPASIICEHTIFQHITNPLTESFKKLSINISKNIIIASSNQCKTIRTYSDKF